MSEQKPDAATLANLADAASKLAALLTENGGRWCEDIFAGCIELGRVELALVQLAESCDSPIWTGWPISAPAQVAKIAKATAAIRKALTTTAAQHNAGESASGKASDEDVAKLALAAERLSAMNKPKTIGDRQAPTFKKTDIEHKTGLGTTSIAKYMKIAGVKIPRKGGKNHRYTLDELCKTLAAIIDKSPDDHARNKCRAELNSLAEITR